MEDLTIKTRRAIRSNNFTQQTNALDVDKHMYVLSTRLGFGLNGLHDILQDGLYRGESQDTE